MVARQNCWESGILSHQIYRDSNKAVMRMKDDAILVYVLLHVVCYLWNY